MPWSRTCHTLSDGPLHLQLQLHTAAQLSHRTVRYAAVVSISWLVGYRASKDKGDILDDGCGWGSWRCQVGRGCVIHGWYREAWLATLDPLAWLARCPTRCCPTRARHLRVSGHGHGHGHRWRKLGQLGRARISSIEWWPPLAITLRPCAGCSQHVCVVTGRERME